ncbi:pro-neuregulin-3, membrane-bound isoform [Lampris incognitus]|uniref:pro-neuregulin-3, membrane-bound isoform n=1 Tax=Lampris incognitus TaxID=2546036 RepID=UPI0024B62B36|nr:pro-neuregulin-3, membrane-bound isoform [Lampris incognitus]
MSECSGAAVSGAVILEEPEGPGGSGGRGEGQAQDQGPLRCGGCTLWPRQQTWLCVVPLLIGFIGLGLSLMLLKWIVVGTVRDYVPTDLVDANRMGQDPIFLSKPSGVPKNPDTTTTTTIGGGNPTARTVTVAKGITQSATTTTTVNPRGGGASGSQVTPRNPGNRNGRGPGVMATTSTASRTNSATGPATPSPSPSNPTVLHDSTQMWTLDHTTTQRASTTLTTRIHGHHKTPASPTTPPLRSEHFKPCHEKDLAYCLNDGECFVIETLSGPHKHCKCREGYQGIRCDQFLPKTDSILSDPTDHLGIEFMESKEVSKRQVLSITSIAMAISLLGTLCMALYCRNKRRREKLQAHLKESRSHKNYSANAPNALDAKAGTANTNMQMHKYCKRSSQSREGTVCESSFCNINNTPSNSSRGPVKYYRSGSLSHSPDQRARASHWSVPRRTPPIPRGRLNPIGGSKYSSPAYQHLQEVEPSEREAEGQRGSKQEGESPAHDAIQDTILHIRPPVAMETTSSSSSSSSPSSWGSHVTVSAPSERQDPIPISRSLRRPSRRPGHSSPPPFRSCSIPIIPSVQGHHDNEMSCMQTSAAPAAESSAVSVTCCATPLKDEGGPREGARETSSSSCSSAIGQPEEEVALLLKEAQEQLSALALAHRRQEEGRLSSGSVALSVQARETVCFLSPNGGGAGGLSSNGPTETQLFSHSLSHRDVGQTGK